MPALRLEHFRNTHEKAILDRLIAWLSVPSISADPDHHGDVRSSATWLCETALDAGFTRAEILETRGLPAVYAEWLGAGPGAPTVLVYGHHDVQPVDPTDQWVSPPFSPRIVDGECFARGAIDDKGQVLYHVEAVRGLLKELGELEVNLKLLIEGEEEVGSPHFEALLNDHRELFSCDVIVISDTSMLAPNIPSTDVAMRGLVACTITLTTAKGDLHSGSFGGAVPNPIHHLVHLLDKLHDDSLGVAIPGFLADVRALSPAETASLAAQPFSEDEFASLAGARFLEGEHGFSTLERIGARPTAEIVGVRAGYGDGGIKTIVPASATAKVAFRLVPDQQPDRIMALIQRWVRDNVTPDVAVSVEWHGGVAPVATSDKNWALGALYRAIESVWGKTPLSTRVGGSGPEEMIGRILEAPLVFLGVGLPTDRIHAPNERMNLEQFWRGLLGAGELYHELAIAYRQAH